MHLPRMDKPQVDALQPALGSDHFWGNAQGALLSSVSTGERSNYCLFVK